MPISLVTSPYYFCDCSEFDSIAVNIYPDWNSTVFQMSLGPFFRSPFTDLTASMVNFQQYDKCGPMEMAAIDCLEAYGTIRGNEKCADLLADFKECAIMSKQVARFRVRAVVRRASLGLRLTISLFSCRRCGWRDIVRDCLVTRSLKNITPNRHALMRTKAVTSRRPLNSIGVSL